MHGGMEMSEAEEVKHLRDENAPYGDSGTDSGRNGDERPSAVVMQPGRCHAKTA